MTSTTRHHSSKRRKPRQSNLPRLAAKQKHSLIHRYTVLMPNAPQQPGLPQTDQESRTLDTDTLTWAALLGQWVEFARSAVGLPDTGEGKQMRESIADIIMLQAVWFALQHLQDLAGDERAIGLDRAELLIDKHENDLKIRWNSEIPNTIVELIADARNQLATVENEGMPQ